jgi:hypothetical protein
MGLISGPNKADDTFGRTTVTGTMDRGFTVLHSLTRTVEHFITTWCINSKTAVITESATKAWKLWRNGRNDYSECVLHHDGTSCHGSCSLDTEFFFSWDTVLSLHQDIYMKTGVCWSANYTGADLCWGFQQSTNATSKWWDAQVLA